MHKHTDFSTPEAEQKMQVRVTQFNRKRANKSWSKRDLDFFIQALTTSFDKEEAVALASTLGKTTTTTKRQAIVALCRLPIVLAIDNKSFKLFLDETLPQQQEDNRRRSGQ